MHHEFETEPRLESLVWIRAAEARRRSVALYYFNLRTGGDTLVDEDGREIADRSDVAATALREARAMIGHEALSGRISLDQHIEVRDEAGELVHRLSFRDAVSISDRS